MKIRVNEQILAPSVEKTMFKVKQAMKNLMKTKKPNEIYKDDSVLRIAQMESKRNALKYNQSFEER